jgi:predicted deacylase
LGGSGIITPQTMGVTYDGLLRVLGHLGNLISSTVPELDRQPSRLVSVPGADYYVHADDAGLFEPVLNLGSPVERGAVVGYLHAIDRIDRMPVPVLAPQAGLLLCVHGQGLIQRNDTLVVIAVDYAP